MVSPEAIHTSSIICAQQTVFRIIYVCENTYIHAITISEERGHEFEGEQGVYVREFGERKGKGEIL